MLNPLPIAPTISDDTDMTIAVSLNKTTPKKYKIKVPEKEISKDSYENKNGLEKLFFDIEKKAEELFKKEKEDTFDEMGMFEIMGQTIDIMQNSILECKMAGYTPDMIIGIPHDACGFYEFDKAYEIIEIGRIIAKENLKILS